MRPAAKKVAEWTKDAFEKYDAIVFVGAAAIAVRSIAPCLKDKLTDPAVLVVDEKNQYVIPILSGHVGGANALAVQLAAYLQAIPVITTATDIQGLFAVDVFAVKNHLLIADRRKAKELSASILEYEQKLVYADAMLTHEAVLPKYLSMKGLQLIPEKTVWIGIGCRKGTETDKIKAAIRYFLTEHAIDERSVAGIASIDVKAQEQGILDACREYNWPFITFSAEKLCALEGDFTASEFVKSHVGVDNVCERSALCAAGENEENGIIGHGETILLIRKEIMPGITLAAAGTGRRLRFE